MAAGDGFNVDELNCADPSTHSSIKKDDGYVNKSIASLKPGHSNVSISGRIVNLYYRETDSKADEVKKILSIIVKDIDGVIEVAYLHLYCHRI
jgi:hypothetical protein